MSGRLNKYRTRKKYDMYMAANSTTEKRKEA